jgi:hypothetical protein
MVAVVIAFPGSVTSHVSKAAGVEGTGLEELQRQIGGPRETAPGDTQPEGGDDAGAELERQLKK